MTAPDRSAITEWPAVSVVGADSPAARTARPSRVRASTNHTASPSSTVRYTTGGWSKKISPIQGMSASPAMPRSVNSVSGRSPTTLRPT